MKRAPASLILLVVLGMVTASKAATQATPAALPQPPVGELTGEFKFFLAGVRMPDRVVGFFKESGASFAASHRWCESETCSFAVGDLAVGGESMIPGPKIVFKLSQDGTILTATCKASVCFITISEETVYLSRNSFSADLKSLRNLESLDIPTKARVLFTVKK